MNKNEQVKMLVGLFQMLFKNKNSKQRRTFVSKDKDVGHDEEKRVPPVEVE